MRNNSISLEENLVEDFNENKSANLRVRSRDRMNFPVLGITHLNNKNQADSSN